MRTTFGGVRENWILFPTSRRTAFVLEINDLKLNPTYDFPIYLPIYLSVYLSMALHFFVGPWPPFQFLDLLHSRYDSLEGGSGRRKAATCTQESTNISVPQVGSEPTIQVFEWAKTVHALDRAATVIGYCKQYVSEERIQDYKAIGIIRS
jgi:hypothetical protein